MARVAGVGALVGAIGLAAAPVAAPVALGAVVAVGAATSVYGIVRSSIHLADRGKHEQDIGLLDSESRASWLNILVSTAGLSFSVAGKLLSWAASTGTNIKYKKYHEKPTKLELFQFTSSLLFFGIGVMSNKTAQDIVEDAQARKINNFRDSLKCDAKRKIFDKITAEIRRVRGSFQGNVDVIKRLRTITNKDEFFTKLCMINKELNANELRILLSADESTLNNDQHMMTLTKLNELGKLEPANVNSKNVQTKINAASVPASVPVLKDKNNILCKIRPEEILRIAGFIRRLSQKDKKFFCELLSEISSDVHQKFMLLSVNLMDSLVPEEIDNLLSIFGSNWKMRVLNKFYEYFDSQIENNDPERKISFKRLLNEFIVHGKIKAESIETLKDMILTQVSEEKDRNPGPNSDPKKYDGIFEFRKKTLKIYELEAGKAVKIGIHEVLIRQSTLKNLKEFMSSYCQQDADILLKLCFEILQSMSLEEVSKLNYVNLDEDVIMRIACFIMDWNAVDDLLDMFKKNGCINIDTIERLKKGTIDWALADKLRKHEICKQCKGVRYCD